MLVCAVSWWPCRADDAAKGEALQVANAKHVKVYAEAGRFGGWPANHGLWSWGDEILVGFSAGYYKDLGDRHHIDRDKPEEHLLARSVNGGETWTIENPSAYGALIPAGTALHGSMPPGLKEKPWQDCPGGIDFAHPDFAMTLRMTDVHTGPSRFYTSTDRGHRWDGPYRLPLFGQQGIAARTDYMVNGRHDCLVILTASKANGREGRPLCVRTEDGGKSWKFVSWIGEEPQGYSIMPSSVRLSEQELLTAVRCRNGEKSWIECYRSTDNGASWTLDSTPVPDAGEGNPASLIRLRNGRLCLTYGYRAAPFRMYALMSQDKGMSWSKKLIVRDGGGGRDIGYPRSVERPDGKIVTIYYFHDSPQTERYIAATIWSPQVVANYPRAGVQTQSKTEAASIEQSPLWTSSQDGYHTYRIPSLLVTAKGSVLAFCEGRKSGSGDHGDLDLVMKRSTDGGRTWSTQSVVYEEGGNAKITIGNPCPVVDRDTGAIWLPICRDNKEVLLLSSIDDGLSWSPPRNLSLSVVKPDWTWVATGPGIGIQLQRGPHRGRLIIPCDHKRMLPSGEQEMNSHAMFSDDHGQTWQISQPIQTGGNECQVIERADGSLLLNARMQGGFLGFRGIAVSSDGGATWSAFELDRQLPCPKCQGSLIRYDAPDAASPPRLLFSNPHPPTSPDGKPSGKRVDLTIRMSLDEGKTWPIERLLHRGPAAYSSLASLPDGTILCLYEGGETSAYQTLRLARFNLTWLTN